MRAHAGGCPALRRDLIDRRRHLRPNSLVAASTVNAILDSDLIEQAAQAGMRSVFIGIETLNPENRRPSTS